jgi:predicted N-acetyltransferase YhbS
VIRAFLPQDLPDADAVYRAAFANQFGIEPSRFRVGSDALGLRLRGQPHCCFVAADHHGILGSIVGLDWGNIWILGPLTVAPAAQGSGIARQLVDTFLEAAGSRLVGLWTFPSSLKHLYLYQRVGFLPRYLVGVGAFPAQAGPPLLQASLADLPSGSIFAGLDLSREQGGSVLALPSGDAAALVHVGAGSEAGPDELYVKFAAASSPDAFRQLLHGLAATASHESLLRVKAGVNTARRGAWAALQDQGWRPAMFGVAMHRPDLPAWDHSDAWVIDDWQ